MTTKKTDMELLFMIQNKNHHALEELYDRYERLIYNFAYRIVHSEEAAEEVVQDVFLKIWKQSISYSSAKSKLTTWMLTITRNTAIDVLRTKRPRQQPISLEEYHTDADAHHSPSLFPSVEAGLEYELIQEALSSLPTDQRIVIEYIYFEGYSQSETAQQLSIPLGTIKGRVRLAMNKLKTKLRRLRGESNYGNT